MYVENRTKIANFPTPRVFNAPDEGVPRGIWYRPKCLNDGPTRWSKKFSDRFSRFDTIPAVTDTQPATQPRRRSYKASSLKSHRALD